ESGTSGVLITAIGFVLFGFAAWSIGATQYSSRRWRGLGWFGAGLATCLALIALRGIGNAPAEAQTARDSEPFSPARLAAYRAEGRPVFVNMTAAWCVTCLVNERVAISNDAVRRAFAE